MQYLGTVQGEAARKYAGFTYRKPILRPLEPWNLDPARLNWMHEYPRSTAMPRPTIDAVDLADYEIRIGSQADTGMSKVQVWLRPNRFTAAKKSQLVFEFETANAFTLRKQCADEALRRAFASPAK